MRTLLVAAPVLAAVSIAAGLAPRQPDLQFLIAPAVEKPAISLVGPNSGIQQRRFERIRDEESWQTLWNLHAKDAGPRAAQGWLLAPQVDFKKYEVVAFFRGDATNNNGEVVDSLYTAGELVVIRFDSITFQTAGAFNAAADRPSSVSGAPYGIWVIPRTAKPITIEENVQGMKDMPAQWQIQHRFPVPPPSADDGC